MAVLEELEETARLWLLTDPQAARRSTPRRSTTLRQRLRRTLVTPHAPLRRQPLDDVHGALRSWIASPPPRRTAFDAVEFLFPYEHAPEEIASRLREHGLQQALFNLPPGDFARGERGIAACRAARRSSPPRWSRRCPMRRPRGCQRLHAMAGLVAARRRPRRDARHLRRQPARWRPAALAPHGITLLIEPINTRDIPGYFLNHQQAAHDIVAEVGAAEPEGADGPVPLPDRRGRPRDAARSTGCRRVGHFQIAGVPRPPRAGRRRSELRAISSTLLDELGLGRARRLRIPAARRHVRGAGLAARLSRFSSRNP